MHFVSPPLFFEDTPQILNIKGMEEGNRFPLFLTP